MAREEWKTKGLTLLPCGVRFIAIRVPVYVAEAAADSTVPAEVGAYLAQALLGAPVIRCHLGQWLCEPGKAEDWLAPGAEPLSEDHQLGVPCPDLVEHPGRTRSYWAVPMSGLLALGSACAVSQLVAHDRLRVASTTHNPEHRPGKVKSIDLGPARQAWDEIMKLTQDLPHQVPPRAVLEPVAAELRVYVDELVHEVQALIEDDEDSSDREATQWLLGRVHNLLVAEPAVTDREAAMHAEDMALSCRTLAGVYQRRTRHSKEGSCD